jgi:twitching motility protein PilJ
MPDALNSASLEAHSPGNTIILINPVLIACALLFCATISLFLFNSNKSQKAFTPALITSHLQTHAQRLAKVAPKAMAGKAEAFEQLQQSITEIDNGVMVLTHGGDYLSVSVARPNAAQVALLDTVKKAWGRSSKAASTILKLKLELSALSETQEKMKVVMPVMYDLVYEIQKLQMQGGASQRDISTSKTLQMLVLRLTNSATEVSARGNFALEDIFMLGKDSNTFDKIVTGFLNGSEALRLSPTKDPKTREQLIKLQTSSDIYQKHTKQILRLVPDLLDAKAAETLIIDENEQLTQSLNKLHQAHLADRQQQNWAFWAMLTRFF